MQAYSNSKVDSQDRSRNGIRETQIIGDLRHFGNPGSEMVNRSVCSPGVEVGYWM